MGTQPGPVPDDRGGRGQPSSACKFGLVGLANHAGPDGTGAFPSVATLGRIFPTGHVATFALISFVLVIVPGPNVLFVVSRSLMLGRATGSEHRPGWPDQRRRQPGPHRPQELTRCSRPGSRMKRPACEAAARLPTWENGVSRRSAPAPATGLGHFPTAQQGLA